MKDYIVVTKPHAPESIRSGERIDLPDELHEASLVEPFASSEANNASRKIHRPTTAKCDRLVLAAPEVAELLGISERHLWSLHAAGRIPRPVALGRSRRWVIDEIREWLTAGSPARDKWEASRKEASTKKR